MADTTTDRPLPPFLLEKRDAIAALYREYGVAKLEVFGSVMTHAFDPERSDVDFIVDYLPNADLGRVLERYLELIDRLRSVLGRDVDLVMKGSNVMRDPFFRRFADPTRRTLFDALQGGQTSQRHPTTERVPA